MNDVEVIKALNALRLIQPFASLTAQPATGGRVSIRFTMARDDRVYSIQLPLPSSQAIKPWVVITAQGWEPAPDAIAHDMVSFMRDEIDTGAREWGYMLEENGEVQFVLERYGFRHNDDGQHYELLIAAGAPGDWAAR
ncbi:hypothetical protein ACQCX2_13520 [Propionibacteriaceae bacterium Y1700]|uniref:hypothetical protein n=1 Tax=Microlunatus sp. Y1700 TaxID=3418487 RepID=UPI003DA78156